MKPVMSAFVDPDAAGVRRGLGVFTPELAVRVTRNQNALGKVEQANEAGRGSGCFTSRLLRR